MSGSFVTRRFFSAHAKQQFFFQKFFQPVIDASKPHEHIVSQLLKPVGLTAPPNATISYSQGNSFKDLFDEKKTKQRTDELTLEMSKSGMYDMFTFRKTNGKMFYAPKSYWKKDKALYFPHLSGKPVLKGAKSGSIEDNLRGKINIVRIFGSKTGDELCAGYLKDIDNKLKESHDKVQVVNVSWMENYIKTLVVKMSIWSMRSAIPKNLQKNYFICDREQLPFSVRENLNINNLYTGYILLVDQNLKIRWMASGGSNELEYETLWKSINGLIQESDDNIQKVIN